MLNQSDLNFIICNLIFTARKRSWGKVMFLLLPVSHSVQHGGDGAVNGAGFCQGGVPCIGAPYFIDHIKLWSCNSVYA